MPQAASPPADPSSVMRSRQFVGVLVLAALVGLIASFAAWCFLELVNLIQEGVYEDLPDALGYDHVPLWWSLPILAIAGLVVAFAGRQAAGSRRPRAGRGPQRLADEAD